MLRFPRLMLLSILLCVGMLGPLRPGAVADSRWQVLAPVHAPPVLYQPSGIAVDPAGHLFVTDAAAAVVQKLSATGHPLATWGANGPAREALGRPTGISRGKNGDLYVADPGKRKLAELVSPSETAQA